MTKHFALLISIKNFFGAVYKCTVEYQRLAYGQTFFFCLNDRNKLPLIAYWVLTFYKETGLIDIEDK